MASQTIDGVLVQVTDTSPSSLIVARRSVWGDKVLCWVDLTTSAPPSMRKYILFAPHLFTVARALRLFRSVAVLPGQRRRLDRAYAAYRALRRHAIACVYEFFAHATLLRSHVHLPRDVREEVRRRVVPDGGDDRA